MTREEQILNKAIDYSEIKENFLEYDDFGDVCDDKGFVEKAFIEGAKWADENPNLSEEELIGMDELGMMWQKKHLINRSYEYLRTHLWQNVDADNDPIVESVRNITLDDFIKDFKRYLEE